MNGKFMTSLTKVLRSSNLLKNFGQTCHRNVTRLSSFEGDSPDDIKRKPRNQEQFRERRQNNDENSPIFRQSDRFGSNFTKPRTFNKSYRPNYEEDYSVDRYRKKDNFDSDNVDHRESNRGFDHNTRSRSPPRWASPRYGTRNNFNLQHIQWTDHKLVDFKKDFYEEHPDVTNRSQEDINRFYEEAGVTLQGVNVPRPIFDFSEVNFPEYVMRSLQYQKWDKPTTIQAVGWPIALSGSDLVGIAQTGSGKTLGFILPAIVHIKQQPPRRRGDGPVCLVIVPTRELAQQVNEVAVAYGAPAKLRSVAVYGGTQKSTQLRNIERGVDILVATPGRLQDLLQMGAVNLHRTTYLVLDEGDRMLDMGFEPDIRTIVGQIRPDRQTLMWSATWPQEVRELASDFLRDPIQVNVGSTKLQANPNITQKVEIFHEPATKLNRLYDLVQELIQESKQNKILIFAATKRMADMIARRLYAKRLRASSIHGDLGQSTRDRRLNEFRRGECSILVATDVASRGLDVDDIGYVINFDHPNCSEDYIHRIGRTGRASKTGTSYTFFVPEKWQMAKELVDILRDAKQEVPQELYRLSRRDAEEYRYNTKNQGRPRKSYRPQFTRNRYFDRRQY